MDTPLPIAAEKEPSGLRGWWDAFWSLVYPEVCQICGEHRAIKNNGYVCASCLQQVKPMEPPFCSICGCSFEGEITTEFQCGECLVVEPRFEWARAAVRGNDFMVDLIGDYKYNRHVWLEPLLARLLVEKAVPSLVPGEWNMIIPVPMHPAKKREREFNQAERLGKHLSRASGIPLRKDVLVRTKRAEVQARLNKEERKKNVKGLFAVSQSADIQGHCCVVVDDILTTGATASECAAELREAGARRVVVWTLARRDRRNPLLA